jgi:hypothetical protein
VVIQVNKIIPVIPPVEVPQARLPSESLATQPTVSWPRPSEINSLLRALKY